MNGTIVSVSVNLMTVSVSGVYYAVQLAYGALVTLDGVTCNLGDLQAGDTVSLTLTTEPTNIPYASAVVATR